MQKINEEVFFLGRLKCKVGNIENYFGKQKCLE